MNRRTSPSFTEWFRDRAYDTIFHIGDTAFEFTADLIRGSEPHRSQGYTERQLDRQERKTEEKAKKVAPKPEKPLNYDERQIFLELTGRREGESVIEHWKRRKELLAHPHKRELVQAHVNISAEEKKQEIQVVTYSTAETYQKERVRSQSEDRKSSQKRRRTR